MHKIEFDPIETQIDTLVLMGDSHSVPVQCTGWGCCLFSLENLLMFFFKFMIILACPVEFTEPLQTSGCSRISPSCPMGWTCQHHAADGWHVCCRENAPPSCEVSLISGSPYAVKYN